MTYCFDLDNTICATPSSKNYEECVPYRTVINKINALKLEGHLVKIFTARGSGSGKNWHELTVSQLEKWKVNYDELIDKGKPSYDVFIDDKNQNAYEWRRNNGIGVTGFVAGAFDLLHAGHCLYLKEAKNVCDYLYAALQVDPSLEDRKKRPLGKPKNKPIQSFKERRIQLESISYVDEIVEYETEEDLRALLRSLKPDIRVLGCDYKDVLSTGEEFCGGVIYHSRNHEWSSSYLRRIIIENSK